MHKAFKFCLDRNFGAKMLMCLDRVIHHKSDSYLVLQGHAGDVFFVLRQDIFEFSGIILACSNL